MKPILIDDTKLFSLLASDTTLGLGMLHDSLSAIVREAANGEFTAEIVYPVTGRRYRDLHAGGIVKLKPNETGTLQLFRISRISKPLNGRVTIYLNHISYDLSKAIVLPCQAVGIGNAISAIQSNTVETNKYPFAIVTDKSGGGNFKIDVPRSVRAAIGGQQGSLLDLYGGELEWDNFTVHLHSHRGYDNGVSIRYGKNLTGLTLDESIESSYSAVLPFASVSTMDGSSSTTTVGTLHTITQADPPRIMLLDLSGNYTEGDSTPSANELDAACEAYIDSTNLTELSISADVNFVALWQTEEYKSIAPLERVSLFDTVHVYHPGLDVNLTARVTETVYDCLAERYKKIHLGAIKASLAKTIAQQKKQVEQQKTELTSWWQDAIKKNTDTMNGVNGGYKYVVTDSMGRVVEEYWLDTPSIETAVNVRRENFNGIAYSHNGINGPFVSAWLMDGSFTAELMQTLQLRAQQIVAGALTVADENGNETFYVNVDTGEVRIVADSFSLTSGKTLEGLEDEMQGTVVAKETLYLVNTGSTPTQDAQGWTSSPTSLSPGLHLWAMEKTTFLSGRIVYSVPVDLTGPDLVSSERYYKLSSSGTVPDVPELFLGDEFYLGNETYLTISPEQAGWSTTHPDYIPEKYLWERWKFTYEDGSVLWTPPTVNKWYFDISHDISEHYEEMHTSFEQTNALIALKADRTVVDANYVALTGEINRVEYEASAALTIESNRIQSSVSETIRQTKSELRDGYENAISVSQTTLRSEITQTANSITATIQETREALEEDYTGAINSTKTALQSQITQTASSITATISATKEEIEEDYTGAINTAKSTLQSQITQTASSLTSTIASTKEEIEEDYTGAINTAKSTLQSQITQTANSITASLTGTIESTAAGLQDDIDEVSGDLSDLSGVVASHRTDYETSLSLMQGQIASKVAQTEFTQVTNTLSGQITTTASNAHSELVQTASSLTSTIASTKEEIEEDYTGAISSARQALESSITQTTDAIALTLRGEIEDAIDNLDFDANIGSLSDLIDALEDDLESLQGVVSSNHTSYTSQFSVLQGLIDARVTQTTLNQTVDTINGTIATEKSNLQGEIAASINSIALTLRGEVAETVAELEDSIEDLDGDLSTLSGTVTQNRTDYETSVTLLQGQISSKVSQSDFNNTVTTINGNITSAVNTAKSDLQSEISQTQSSIISTVNGTIATTKTTIETGYANAIATAKGTIEDDYADAIASAKDDIEDDYTAAIAAAKQTTETTFNSTISQVRGEIALKATETSVQSRFDAQGQLINQARSDASAELSVATSGITAEISRVEGKTTENGRYIEDIASATAYLSPDGLFVETSGASSTTKIDGDGLEVIDSATNDTMLEATSQGVVAKQLTAADGLTIQSGSLKLIQRVWYSEDDNEYGIGFFVAQV